MIINVERVSGIGVEDFQRIYSAQNRPVIVAGSVEHWPARKKWNLDYFANKYPTKELNFSGRRWQLTEFIQQLRSDVRPTPYLNQVKLDEQFTELYEDIGDLAFTRRNLLNSRLVPPGMRIVRGIKALFIGGDGSGFGKLHWDSSYLHVFISQLHGDKDFLLYAPSDTPFLYQNPACENDTLIKDFNDFDMNEFPNVRKATPLRFTVAEGETVFIPAGWWHATKMRGVSISLAESALDKFNWRRRYQDYLAEYRRARVSRVKCALLATYMRSFEALVL